MGHRIGECKCGSESTAGCQCRYFENNHVANQLRHTRGSKSYDPDGTINSFAWSQASGPSTATITNSGTSAPTVAGLVAGTYVFQLSVTDNGGATTTAQ